MKQRKIIAILTLVCFMFTLLPVTVMAEVLNENGGVSETAETEAATSGTCGENLTWELVDGVLTISGTGEMDWYSQYETSEYPLMPWYDVRAKIKKVIITEGVTSIGSSAFYDCYELTDIQLPKTISRIGYYAFEMCTALKSVILPTNVSKIEQGLFYECSSLNRVDMPKGITHIDDYAFSGCSSLTNMDMPDSVIEIGYRTFYNCSSLVNIDLPMGLMHIGNGIFENCSSLVEVKIPDSVLQYESSSTYNSMNEMFKNCTSLTNVELPQNQTISNIGSEMFYGCTSLESITLPNGIDFIKTSAFENCTSLSTIDLPDGITLIGWKAFAGCESLENIDIPGTVTVIDNDAFAGCSSLKDIILPDVLTEIRYNAFSGCSALTKVIIPASVTEINAGAFRGCASLTEIKLPDGLDSIAEETFKNCTALSDIKLPDAITSIGKDAFLNCQNLLQISIPDNVIDIGKGAFDGCVALEIIDIGNGVSDLTVFKFNTYPYLESVLIGEKITNIPAATFKYCGALSNVTISDNVAEIGKEAFKDCEMLVGIDFPSSLKKIDDSAFSGCLSLENIVFPENINHIGKYAFRNCKNITQVEIPDDVSYIGEDAFNGCSLECVNTGAGIDNLVGFDFSGNKETLNNVKLGNSVTTIGDREFYNCKKLKEVTIGTNVEKIGSSAFEYCTELKSIELPDSVKAIGSSAFYGCNLLEKINIPDGVQSICAYIFCNCDALKTIVLPDTVTLIEDKAFANCDSLISIVIPDTVTIIAENAFVDSDNLTIYGYAGSYAETYANQKDIPFVALTEGDIPSTEGTIISILSEAYELKIGEDNAIPLMYGITPDSAKNQDVTWTIADESIIKPVDVPVGGYWIEGLKPGTTAITATTEDGASSTRTITVANENISGTNGTTISIYTDKELVCNVGSTLEVQANALYAVPVGERGTITWSIGNPAVLEEVSVKTDMLKGCSTIQVKGLQSGETTLTATTSDGSSATTTVKVMTVIKHDYRTLVGILQGYDAATKQICVDGSYYPVASAVSIGDDLSSINVTDMIGKQVHVLLDNGEVISFGTMESVKTRVDILWIAASTGRNVIYQNGKYDKDTIPVTINIKNSVRLSSGYDLSVICKYLDSSAVLKDLSWESSALELHNAEGIKGVTLAPNERHNVEAILKISSGYVPERVTEQISGQATVTAQIRGEACSAQDWINISVGNLDLQQEIAAIQKEQREEKEKPTSESIKNNATSVDKELDNSSSQLILPQNLDWYVMKDPLEKQKLRETIMLWLATVATEPEEKNFTDKLEEKIYTKATKSLKADLKEYFSFKTFGELKEWLGIGVRTVQSSIRVRITTKTAGPQEIILTYNGLIMEAGKKPNGSMGKVTWEFADENAPEYLKAYAKNDFGMSIEADVAAFSEYLYNTAEKAVKDAWDETTGDAINDVASMVTSDLTQTIIKKTCGSFSDGLFDLITGITKRQKINCPVDVYVYDLDGNLCGSIVHNEVQTGKNKVYLYVEDDSKNVWYTGDDYKIKLVGNDTGTMDYTITEFNAENEAIRTVNFYNIPLTTETIYYGAVPMEVFADVAKYQLNEQDGGIITADEDSYIPPVFSEEKETVTIGIDSLTAKVKDNKVNFTARVTDAVTSIVAVSLYYVDGKDVISSEMTYDEALNIWHAETPLVEPVQAFIMAVNANGQQAVKDVDSVESTPDSVAPGGGSSSGGFNGVYNYPVKLNGAVNGATVLFDKANANVGETVTITVKPDAGKKVDEVIVTDANGKEITVTKVGDNKYTFTMPAGKVNVAVTTEAADYDKRIVLQINNKNIVINDKNISNDVSPVIVGERTMVPIRVVTELLGGTAEWNEDIRTVTLKIDDKVLSMIIDQPIPGFGTSATIINNRTYVPIRYVAEKLGANVEWIQAAQQIVIEK